MSYRTLHKMFELLNLKKTRAENMEERTQVYFVHLPSLIMNKWSLFSIQTARRRNRHGRAMSSNQKDDDTAEDRTAMSGLTNSDEERDGIVPDDDLSEPSQVETKKGKRDRASMNSTKSNGHLSALPEDGEDEHLNKFEFSVEVAMLEIYNESVLILIRTVSEEMYCLTRCC
jgi:hypothetical protein